MYLRGEWRCSWSGANRRCSNCIVILHLTPAPICCAKTSASRDEKHLSFGMFAPCVSYFTVIIFHCCHFILAATWTGDFNACCVSQHRTDNHVMNMSTATNVSGEKWSHLFYISYKPFFYLFHLGCISTRRSCRHRWHKVYVDGHLGNQKMFAFIPSGYWIM